MNLPIKEISIRNNNDLIKEQKKFINSIEYMNNKFNENLEKNIADFQKYKNSKAISFIPEKISTKSPLTILDGKWGMGKTYFIENFLKNINDKKINTTFLKIIKIDAWDFAYSSDIIDQFLKRIYKELFKLIKEQKEIVKKIKEFFKIIWKNTRAIQVGFFSFYIKWERNIRKNKDIKMDICFPKTLIFFDNIERLSNESWNVIKLVIKILEIKNIFIILAMDFKKIKNHEMLYKHIYQEYFSLNMSGSAFLDHYDFSKYFKNSITNLIYGPPDNISIRSLENIINADYDIWKKLEFSDFEILIIIFRQTIGDLNIYNRELRYFGLLENYLKIYLKKISDLYNSFKKCDLNNKFYISFNMVKEIEWFNNFIKSNPSLDNEQKEELKKYKTTIEYLSKDRESIIIHNLLIYTLNRTKNQKVENIIEKMTIFALSEMHNPNYYLKYKLNNEYLNDQNLDLTKNSIYYSLIRNWERCSENILVNEEITKLLMKK